MRGWLVWHLVDIHFASRGQDVLNIIEMINRLTMSDVNAAISVRFLVSYNSILSHASIRLIQR